MVIFYSGFGCKRSDPEVVFGREGNVMLTFIDSYRKAKPEQRFRRLVKGRRKARPPVRA